MGGSNFWSPNRCGWFKCGWPYINATAKKELFYNKLSLNPFHCIKQHLLERKSSRKNYMSPREVKSCSARTITTIHSLARRLHEKPFKTSFTLWTLCGSFSFYRDGVFLTWLLWQQRETNRALCFDVPAYIKVSCLSSDYCSNASLSHARVCTSFSLSYLKEWFTTKSKYCHHLLTIVSFQTSLTFFYGSQKMFSRKFTHFFPMQPQFSLFLLQDCHENCCMNNF